MKQRLKSICLAANVVIIMVLCIVGYSSYTQRQIYYESTQNLLSTYGQVTKTFNMFVQRNWNILEIWGGDLVELAKENNAAVKWRRYVNQKANWQYSEVVLFNQEDKFWTVSGRHGDAPHMQAALEEVYTSDEPIVTSYISSKGVRKVMFAEQIEPVQMDGVTYTSLAICYDNTALETLLGGLAYEGQSDCYIVRPNGDVVLSTEPKSEITEQLTNLFDYLKENTEFQQTYFDQMLANIPRGVRGSVRYTFKEQSYYLVYQPVGVEDWAIIGIVPTDVMDSGMRDVQTNTMVLISALALVILFGAGKIFRDGARARREKAEAEKRELQRRKELTEQMFQGMARIVDRFALCDLDNDRYEYHERRGPEIYPEKGSYQWMVEQVSQRYVIMTDGENAKLTQMLTPENLRSIIKTENDAVKFEYAARDKSTFQMMTIVPAGWENGRLTRVMMITQDMGRQHLLQTMANTDGLTGLLNKRYFDTVVVSLEKRRQPFSLFYLDLDRFKPVNDTYGHDMGDWLLQQVSARLQGCIRGTDYAFRQGGDEFALILLGELGEDDCRQKAAEIRKTIGAVYNHEGTEIRIGISCGFARFPAECEDIDHARQLSDKRMYADKQRNHALMDHGL